MELDGISKTLAGTVDRGLVCDGGLEMDEGLVVGGGLEVDGLEVGIGLAVGGGLKVDRGLGRGIVVDGMLEVDVVMEWLDGGIDGLIWGFEEIMWLEGLLIAEIEVGAMDCTIFGCDRGTVMLVPGGCICEVYWVGFKSMVLTDGITGGSFDVFWLTLINWVCESLIGGIDVLASASNS